MITLLDRAQVRILPQTPPVEDYIKDYILYACLFLLFVFMPIFTYGHSVNNTSHGARDLDLTPVIVIEGFFQLFSIPYTGQFICKKTNLYAERSLINRMSGRA